MIVYIISRPKDWNTRTIPYRSTYIRVKKYSFKYFRDIIIEKLKGNVISIFDRTQI